MCIQLNVIKHFIHFTEAFKQHASNCFTIPETMECVLTAGSPNRRVGDSSLVLKYKTVGCTKLCTVDFCSHLLNHFGFTAATAGCLFISAACSLGLYLVKLSSEP